MQEITLKGALFDMDGVYIDSEGFNFLIERSAAALQNIELDMDIFLQTVGTNENCIREFYAKVFDGCLDYKQFCKNTDKMFEEYISEVGVNPKPGAVEALKVLKNRGYKLCLATSNDMSEAKFLMGKIGVLELFDAIITGDIVGPSKPAPDIYIEAAKAVGLRLEECFAVEDSFAGVRSASDAHCVTVMVPDILQPDEEISALADMVLSSLTELPKFVQEYTKKK